MLLGRTREVSEIDGLLRDVRAGRGRAVLLSGDAGIGKTALLDHARDQAIGLRVLGTMGVEAEANLPFAALAEIAGPLVDYVGALPPVQAGAIRAALALGDADPPPSDRLAVCAGLVTLLRAAAEDWPLLLVVDDAQWLDLPSAECLGYAARRLDGARVAVLAAARADEPVRALSGRPVTELRLGGLEPADAEALLRAAGGELAPSAAAALLDAARGNPLALLELPGLLSQEQRLGLEPFAPAPAPGGDLWEALSRRLDALSPGARTAVLVASASIDRTTGPVMGGCSELGAGVDAIEELEQARILRLDGDHVVFVHPLMRGVVAAMGDGADQRRVHAALAKHASPDARPWHLASATVGRSAQVADALDEAGWRAVSRGAHAAAADAFARAADFSEAAGLRIPRQINAALEAAIGGEYERAAAMLDDISDISDPATAVAARHLMAMVTLTGGIRPALESHATLTADAARIADIAPELAADVLADAGVAAVVSGDCRLARASAERAAELLPETATPTTRCHVLAILGMTRALRGDTIGADTALQQAGRLLGDVDPLSAAAQSISFSLHGRLSTGRGAALRDEVLGLGAAAQSAGARGLVPYYLLVAADAAFRLGGWAAAERDVTDAVEIAELSAQRGPLSVALVVRGRVRAARGDEHGARRDLSDALAAAAAPGYGSTRIWAHAALGFLELGLGHPEPAIVELELTSDLSERAGLVDPVIVPWMPDLVEAYC
ncbi:MAG: AAA family ATPase, partial [Solirubrobacteraceae bacterium]|nr:AAA family ATPase [Solirubrobacteraceae bacterium]